MRRSTTLTLLIDFKVGDKADIKNAIERLECSCVDTRGEDVEIIDAKILERKLLIEGYDDEWDH